MNWLYLFSGGLALALFIYLIYALINAEEL